MRKSKRIDAEGILRKLAEWRRSIPGIDEIPRRTSGGDGRLASAATAEDFELLAVRDGLESFADDLDAAVERMREKQYQTALQVYYAAEELARDPAHAHLIPHVEEMRRAHEQQFGRPIPPKT